MPIITDTEMMMMASLSNLNVSKRKQVMKMLIDDCFNFFMSCGITLAKNFSHYLHFSYDYFILVFENAIKEWHEKKEKNAHLGVEEHFSDDDDLYAVSVTLILISIAMHFH